MKKSTLCPDCGATVSPTVLGMFGMVRKMTCNSCGTKLKARNSTARTLALSLISQIVFWGALLASIALIGGVAGMVTGAVVAGSLIALISYASYLQTVFEKEE